MLRTAYPGTGLTSPLVRGGVKIYEVLIPSDCRAIGSAILHRYALHGSQSLGQAPGEGTSKTPWHL